MCPDPVHLKVTGSPKCPVLDGAEACLLTDERFSTESGRGLERPASIQAPICVVGMNHRSAPAEVRAKFAISGEALDRFLATCRDSGVTECVVISTCNRTEVYFAGGEPSTIQNLLAEHVGICVDGVRQVTYEKHCVCAASHLFKVVSGLDSALLGETEIVAQVKDAWKAASQAGTSGPMLDFLFQRAMEANKRVRTESELCRNVTSTATLAIKSAGKIGSRTTLVLGAGRLSERVVKELVSAKATDIRVLNRTLERAEILVTKGANAAMPLSRLESQLLEAELVFTTLSLDSPILTSELLDRVSIARKGRPLLIVDMGVPRNVDSTEAKGVTVVDLDSLVTQRSANEALKEAAVPVALKILEEEVQRFGESLVERASAPTIRSLVAHGEQIKRQNLDWARERLPDLSEKELKVVEDMARRMMLGLLQAPIDGLKSDPIAREHRHVVERLFGLVQGESDV